ncbi:DUF2141 domain-containing protein [Azospirillum sp. sgz302134]
MKSAIGATLLAIILAAGNASAGELRVLVRNVTPQRGAVMVGVYDSAAGLQANRRFAGQELPPLKGEVTAVFVDLPPGRYAVAVYQDGNGDGTLNRNMLGIPTEPYGFGGDVSSTFGAPGFDALAVTVGTGTTAIPATLGQ